MRYADVEWDKLLPDIKAAAITLGYTQEIWENDEEPPTDEHDWDELTSEQQEAAKLLGYTEEKWDE